MAERTTTPQILHIFSAYVAEISFPACAMLSSSLVHWVFLLLVGSCLFFLAMAPVLLVGIFTLCLLIEVFYTLQFLAAVDLGW